MNQQDHSEFAGRSTRISVSLDASLDEFVRRAAGDLHQTKSATIRSMIATMARGGNRPGSDAGMIHQKERG